MIVPLCSSLLSVKHGFFTRHGGISPYPYEGLNGGIQTEDLKENIEENRQKMADFFSVKREKFLPLKQVHGTHIIQLTQDDSLWSEAHAPEADGLVTNRSDIVLTIATADCVPVLFASHCGGIVGAVHAGWKGAVFGILENMIEAMGALGGKDINVVVGPAIAQKSYEVSAIRREEILSYLPWAERFFISSIKEKHYLFDLPALCLSRLEKAGVKRRDHLSYDTVEDDRFFSYRRQILSKMPATGRQISAICAQSLR